MAGFPPAARPLSKQEPRWRTRPWAPLTRLVAAGTIVVVAPLLGSSQALAADDAAIAALLVIALVTDHHRWVQRLAVAGGVLAVVGFPFGLAGLGLGALCGAAGGGVWLHRHPPAPQQPYESDEEYRRRVRLLAFSAPPRTRSREARVAFHVLTWLTIPAAGIVANPFSQAASPGSPGLVLLVLIAGVPLGFLLWGGLPFLWPRPGATTAGAHPLWDATVAPALGAQAHHVATLAAAGGVNRPIRRAPWTRDEGLIVGWLGRHEIAASWEDSLLVLGPPRSGKSSSLIVPLLVEAPGAAITTSTRPDVARASTHFRSQLGPVVAFDPLGIISVPGVERLRWSPVVGCEDGDVAFRRAEAMMGAVSMSTTTSGDFWQSSGADVLAACLHAAALAGGGVAALTTYLANVAGLQRAVQVLRTDGDPGWADRLEGWARSAAEATTGSALATAGQAVASLRLRRVAETCSAPEPVPAADLLNSQATIHLVTRADQASLAPLLCGLLSDLLHAARDIAAHSPTGRIAPPLAVLLDEAANIAPLPELPALLATGGGESITVVAAFQSLAQARARWGPAGAAALVDAATWKIVLPGLAQMEDLTALAALAGQVEEEKESKTTSGGGWFSGQPETTSTTTTTERRPALEPHQLRQLPPGQAYVLARHHQPFVMGLVPYWARPWYQGQGV